MTPIQTTKNNNNNNSVPHSTTESSQPPLNSQKPKLAAVTKPDLSNQELIAVTSAVSNIDLSKINSKQETQNSFTPQEFLYEIGIAGVHKCLEEKYPNQDWNILKNITTGVSDEDITSNEVHQKLNQEERKAGLIKNTIIGFIEGFCTDKNSDYVNYQNIMNDVLKQNASFKCRLKNNSINSISKKFDTFIDEQQAFQFYLKNKFVSFFNRTVNKDNKSLICDSIQLSLYKSAFKNLKKYFKNPCSIEKFIKNSIVESCQNNNDIGLSYLKNYDKEKQGSSVKGLNLPKYVNNAYIIGNILSFDRLFYKITPEDKCLDFDKITECGLKDPDGKAKEQKIVQQIVKQNSRKNNNRNTKIEELIKEKCYTEFDIIGTFHYLNEKENFNKTCSFIENSLNKLDQIGDLKSSQNMVEDSDKILDKIVQLMSFNINTIVKQYAYHYVNFSNLKISKLLFTKLDALVNNNNEKEPTLENIWSDFKDYVFSAGKFSQNGLTQDFIQSCQTEINDIKSKAPMNVAQANINDMSDTSWMDDVLSAQTASTSSKKNKRKKTKKETLPKIDSESELKPVAVDASVSSAMTQTSPQSSISSDDNYINILETIIKNNEEIIQEEVEQSANFTKVLKGFVNNFNLIKPWGYRESLENCQPFNLNIQNFSDADFFIPNSACNHIYERHLDDYRVIENKFSGDTIEKKIENLFETAVNNDADNIYILTDTYQNPDGLKIYVPCVKLKTNINLDNQEKPVVLVFSKLNDRVKTSNNSKKGFVLRTVYFEN